MNDNKKAFNRERLERALKTTFHDAPAGLNREQKRRLMSGDKAKASREFIA